MTVDTDVSAFVRMAGADPETRFRNALDAVGSRTRGPDPSGEYSSNCPTNRHAHGDANPSLRWKVTRNHEVKFHCHAGCEGDEILRALDVRWHQLRPVSYNFDYYEPDGTYRFTVRRSVDVNGEKHFKQVRRDESGVEVDGNGLGDDEGWLWLEPLLESWAEDLRAAGQTGRLWLVEGEKDTVAVSGSGALGSREFVTTAPGGAGGWKPAHTERLRDLVARGVLAAVIVVCDPDAAGLGRGYKLREELEATIGTAGDGVAVTVLAPEPGDDVAALCDMYAARWSEHLRELSENEMALAMEEGSPISGSMTRVPLGLGATEGRVGMAIASEDKVKLVLYAEVLPTRCWAGGWDVRVIPPRGEPREVALQRSDLRSKAAFDRWLAVEARVATVPGNRVASSDVALSLGMWLDWYAASTNVEVVVSTPYLTWVDGDTGEPVRVVGAKDPVWVTEDGADGVRWTGTDHSGCRWGHEGSERDAAWAWARALTFGDEKAVAAVAGWAGAMLLAPWVGRWMPTKPGLAMIAPSGSGKTYGSGRLILQLAGCDGNATSSVAALRRRLSQGGVSSIQWTDDSSLLDDPHLKEILRVATSQGDHILANPDAGAGATQGVRLVGCVVVSAEGVAWLDEVAMSDRFLVTRPMNPQDRRSLMAGREGDLQWRDVQELMAEWEGDLTRLAGWSVDGLRSVVSEGVVEEWVAEVGAPRGRHDVASFVAALGARAVSAWLSRVKAREGAKWPGRAHGGPYVEWSWLVAAADKRVVAAREESRRFGSLIDIVLPAVVRADLGSTSGNAMTSLIAEVSAESLAALRSSVWSQVQVGGKAGVLETAMPMLLVDGDARVWIWTERVSEWFQWRHRGEARIATAKALADQVEAHADDPDWARYQVHKSGGRSYEKHGVQLGKREMGRRRAIYRRLSDEASRAVLEGDR